MKRGDIERRVKRWDWEGGLIYIYMESTGGVKKGARRMETKRKGERWANEREGEKSCSTRVPLITFILKHGMFAIPFDEGRNKDERRGYSTRVSSECNSLISCFFLFFFLSYLSTNW